LRVAVFVLLTLCGWSIALAIPEIPAILQRAPVLNPNFSPYPDASLIDRSATLSAPAGRDGYVTVRDGHFFFASGKRARFFGVNLAKDTVFIEKAQIDRLVELFARAGLNLVRIHHIDDTQGILDPDSSKFFRAERLDLVDYWIARCKARGIYTCLDLNDYRTFRASDGVTNGEALGRGAKPYAVFDPRLIELQQEYARKLLVEHVNPYTQLAYAQDPAIAFLELYDENGLFIRRGDWLKLLSPYKETFHLEWNVWLRLRYGTTEALRAAWTDRRGVGALGASESLEEASIQLPRLDLGKDLTVLSPNPLFAPARVSDGVRFAYDMQTRYLQVMRDALREMGVKIPITAVGDQEILPDLMATAANTDYIGINFYWDHPMWEPGKEWALPAYFSLSNPLTTNQQYSFPAACALARMHGRPLVVRELGYCFPNTYRGVGMLEAAAYGGLLDLDALILFTYDAHPRARMIGYFDIHLDPLRWGIISQAARLFLSGEVAAARTQVGIGYSDVDAFTWHQYQSPLSFLAFVTRVANYTDPATPHPFNLLVSSGRSCGSQWTGDRLLLFANSRHTDIHFQNACDGLDVLHGYSLLTATGGPFDFLFNGFGYDAGVTKSVQAWPPFVAEDIRQKGLRPVATSAQYALGFLDPVRQIVGFRNLRPELAVRMALDALHEWQRAPVSHADIDRNCWRADTGQLERDTANGLLRIDTPTLQVIAGRFSPAPAKALRTSVLSLATTTPIGTLVAESHDGAPLATGRAVSVKMTSRARNDQVKLTTTADGPKPHRMASLGTPPIRTDGEPSTTPTRVEIGGNLLIELNLTNGTWEYVRIDKHALLYLDSGDITITLPVTPRLIRWHTYGDTMELIPTSPTFTVPSGVRYTEILFE
jgi:hypothetical protein